MTLLYKKTIRIAHKHPHLRPALYPALRQIQASNIKTAALGALIGAVVKGVGKAAIPLLKASIKGGKVVSKGLGKGMSKGLGKGVKGVSKSVSKLKLKPKINAKISPKIRAAIKNPKGFAKGVGKQVKNKITQNKEKIKKKIQEKVKQKAVEVAVTKGYHKLKDNSQLNQRAKKEFDYYRKRHPGTKKTVQDFAERIKQKMKKKAGEEDEQSPVTLESDLGVSLEEVVSEVDSMPFEELRPIANAIAKINISKIEDEVVLDHVLFLQKEISKRIQKHINNIRSEK